MGPFLSDSSSGQWLVFGDIVASCNQGQLLEGGWRGESSDPGEGRGHVPHGIEREGHLGGAGCIVALAVKLLVVRLQSREDDEEGVFWSGVAC